ncbi:hypothetical protein M3J09_003773 [Ascochyta lentis]
MTTAFGTPFLLQERTLYGISDYQTGRCLLRLCAIRPRYDIDRTSWMGHVHYLQYFNTTGFPKRHSCSDVD